MRPHITFAMVAVGALALFTVAGNTVGTCVPVEPTQPACVEVDPFQFGFCDMLLGVVFDGRDCVYASGCGCEPSCDDIFPDMASCRDACGLPTGGLPEGAVCDADAECAEGLLCCYPCGIAGCPNRCTLPCDENVPWCAGGCPMYP